MIAQTSTLGIRSSQLVGRSRRGFTLVELMVVVAIIGVLAGFITAAAVGAINKAREAGIRAEIDSMGIAVETYKQKYGSYPPNLQDVVAVQQHILKLFPRCKDAIPTAAGSAANLYRLSAIGGTVTGYQLAGSTVSLGTWERTASIHPLHFWLSGFYPDPEHPLSPPKDSAGNYVTNAARSFFFDFKPGRLRPTGVAYKPDSGTALNLPNTNMLFAYFPEGLDSPYVYFNSSRYDPRDLSPLAAYSYPAVNPDGSLVISNATTGALTPVHLRYARYRDTISIGVDDLPLLTSPFRTVGIDPEFTFVVGQYRTGTVALPYRTKVGGVLGYANPNSFQIISAGLDDKYSGILSGQQPLTDDGMVEVTAAAPANDKITRGDLYTKYFSAGGDWLYPTGPDTLSTAGAGLTRGPAEHKDNLTNFSKGRLENDIP